MGKGHVCRKDMRQFPIMLCGKYYSCNKVRCNKVRMR